MKRIMLSAILLLLASFVGIYAQNSNEEVVTSAPKTLFPYPQVPDTIKTLQNRTNYLVTKFWDKYDLSKPIKDKDAFEGAFKDYIDFFKYAHKTVTLTSIRNFMNKMQSNKANMLIVADMAERNLYSPDAEYWSDEVYMAFIQPLVSSSEIKNAQKVKYKQQISKINNNLLGAVAPDVDVYDLNGQKKKLSSLEKELTFIYISDSSCDECVISRLRLSTDVTLNKLIDEGKLSIICVTPGGYSKKWAEDAKTWSDKWQIVVSDDTEEFDIRRMPSIYILDKDRKIANKNLSVAGLKAMLNL